MMSSSRRCRRHSFIARMDVRQCGEALLAGKGQHVELPSKSTPCLLQESPVGAVDQRGCSEICDALESSVGDTSDEFCQVEPWIEATGTPKKTGTEVRGRISPLSRNS